MKRKSKEELLAQYHKTAWQFYDYTLMDLENKISGKIRIICPRHGPFEQKPREHLSGCGCHLCAGTSVSVVSQRWLSTLNKELKKEHKIEHATGYYVVDGYDSLTNTVYEFYGDYWHGNPSVFNHDKLNKSIDKTFGELYNDTMLREQTLKDLGYNIVTIWESDFYAKII